MKKVKKIILGIGTLATTIGPITTVVACGFQTPKPPIVDPNFKDNIKDHTKTGGVTTTKVDVHYEALPFHDIGDDQKTMKTDDFKNGYWSNLTNKPVTQKTFILEADKCHSIDDIIDMMDEQLHFKLLKNLAHTSPIEFANFITNMYLNNGGGDWNFDVFYKGIGTDHETAQQETDRVVIQPQKYLEAFIKGLDGSDVAPNEWHPAHEYLVTDKTSKGSLGDLAFGKPMLNIESFMQLLNNYDAVFKKINYADMGKGGIIQDIISIVAKYPGNTINAFPNLLEIFNGMAKAFQSSPTANKWAADQSPAVQAEWKDLANQMIIRIFSTGA